MTLYQAKHGTKYAPHLHEFRCLAEVDGIFMGEGYEIIEHDSETQHRVDRADVDKALVNEEIKDAQRN